MHKPRNKAIPGIAAFILLYGIVAVLTERMVFLDGIHEAIENHARGIGFFSIAAANGWLQRIGSGGWATLPQPPPPPADTAGDLESVQRFAAAQARADGYRKPLAAICNMIRTDPSGRVVGAITPPEIAGKIYEGLQQAEYDRIQAPALGIFNKITPQYRLPYYWYLDPARQEEFNRNIKSLANWIEGAIQRFRSGVKNSRVIELHDTNHYVFIVEEALVVREMRNFLLEE